MPGSHQAIVDYMLTHYGIVQPNIITHYGIVQPNIIKMDMLLDLSIANT